MSYTLDFSSISMKMVSEVGGKNASLGEMFNQLHMEGVLIPDGFAVCVKAYDRFLDFNGLRKILTDVLKSLDQKSFSNLSEVGKKARELIAKGTWPEDVGQEILVAHAALLKRCADGITLAVRSSATAEDARNHQNASTLLPHRVA